MYVSTVKQMKFDSRNWAVHFKLSTDVEKKKKNQKTKKKKEKTSRRNLSTTFQLTNVTRTHYSVHLSMKYFHLFVTLPSTATFLFYMGELRFHGRFQTSFQDCFFVPLLSRGFNSTSAFELHTLVTVFN